MIERKMARRARQPERKLHATRNQGGNLWLYGIHAVAAALANPRRKCLRLVGTPAGLASIALSAGGIKAEPLEARDLDRLLPHGAVHQGLALLAGELPSPELETACARIEGEANIVLVLDQVTDPHNVGAMLRSAAAFGARAVITTDRHAPAETGVLAKAASGALDLIPFVRVGNLARALEQLAAWGYWRIGLADQAEHELAALDLGSDIALVLGAEGAGLRRLTAEHCDVLAALPTRKSMPSLNVSNAAAVALYDLARRLKS